MNLIQQQEFKFECIDMVWSTSPSLESAGQEKAGCCRSVTPLAVLGTALRHRAVLILHDDQATNVQ